MLIGEQEFLRLIPKEEDRELSVYYFDHGTFEEFSVRFDSESETIRVEAIFRAHYYKNHVQLVLDPSLKVSEISCDCPYCRANSGCAHVGAVLLKLFSLPETDLPYFETQDRQLKEQLEKEKRRKLQQRQQVLQRQEIQARRLIERCRQRFVQQMDRLTMNQKVRLAIRLEQSAIGMRDLLILHFRIGQTKMYKIKNLEQFLQRIENQEMVTYGKMLTFDHDWESFDEEAQQQIVFLRRQLHDHHLAYGADQLIVNEKNLDEFFDLYSSLSDLCSELNFQTEQGTLHLMAKAIEEAGRLFWQFTLPWQQMLLFGKNNVYTLKNDRFIRFCLDSGQKSMELLKILTAQKELWIPEEQLEAFYKYVLSDLGEAVSIEGLPEALFDQQETDFKLYGELDENGEIRLTLTYSLGTQKGYGFDEHHPAHSLTLEKIERILSFYANRIDWENHQAVMNTADPKAWQFVQEGLLQLADFCEIYVSDALKNLGTTRKLDLCVGLRFKEDLLQVELDSVEMDSQEILEVLRSYRRKKKFHRLKNGRLLALNSPQLAELNELVDELGIQLPRDADHLLQAPAYRVFAAEELCHSMKALTLQQQPSMEDFLSRFQTPSSFSPLPKHYEAILRDYQKAGVEWLKKMAFFGFGGILADDMGLGKTLQVIAYLESEKKVGRKSLVICPSSLLLNWQEEIRRFSRNLNGISILGSAASRKRQIEQSEKADVLILSYDYLRRDIELLKDQHYFAVILDEAQYIKNQKTRNALCVKQLQAEHRFALTGTPIENNLAELWSIFDFLMPDYLYSYRYFLQKYERPIIREQDEKRSEQLRKRVEPFILRRLKREVLAELPDKIENTYTISFDEEERKLYLANLMQVNAKLQEKLKLDPTDRIEILAMLTRLRQLCCEPRLIYENISTVSSKLRGCLELIQALVQGHHPVLLFSSFTTMLELIAKQLDQLGIRYLTLIGKTDKQTRVDRIEEFQTGQVPVFLISLKAGGTGLNLTAAEAVIHYDPWWNLSAQNQATDRAYRIGQTRNVQVFKLIMQDSIEEKILRLQEKKKNLADTFIEGSSGSITSMSAEEIVELLRI